MGSDYGTAKLSVPRSRTWTTVVRGPTVLAVGVGDGSIGYYCFKPKHSWQ